MKRPNRLARARPNQARKAQAAPVAAAGAPQTLQIEQIGARGDAVAFAEGRPIYTPFALPGETVTARVLGERAELVSVVSPSPERQDAACAHFGRCGGCQLQHWQEAPYLAWKQAQVAEALAKRGMAGVGIDPCVPAWGEGRRRAAFHVGYVGGRVRIGFIERGGATLTPISECPALVKPLEALALRLPILAEAVLKPRAEATIQCLWTDAGADVAVKGAGRADLLGRAELERLSAVAAELDLARLSIDGEPIVMRAKPVVRMGKALVSPPPGAFLQATALGEEMLARRVLEALQGADRVIDLFAGIGTFALRLAEQAEVTAVESSVEMLTALKQGADGAGGALKQVTTLRRDLLRTPVSSLEMRKFEGAVIDPPRSGARLQAEQVARAPIRKLAYVSCDPGSFARDLKVLIENGFSLTRVTPVDQFRWSPHIELVAALER